MSLFSRVWTRRGPSGFGYSSSAEEVTEGLDLSGRSILVTGSNSGLGLETARVLARRGASIVALARSEDKASEVIRELPGGGHHAVACELSEPRSVRAAVEAVRARSAPIDALVCNAGIMALPERTLAYGHELQFFTNHVGHFLLVTGLVDRLAPKGRVVVLSSAAHQFAPSEGIRFDDLSFAKGYSGARAYGQSKLANLLFARALSKRLDRGQTANAVHPGVIATNLGRHMNIVVRTLYPVAEAIAMKSVGEGAATQCYVAAHPSVEGTTGQYFADCNVAKTSRHGRDDAMAERLWTVTEEIVRSLG
jgi:NAD(P)-dependent dehydrogenase (short-subunit alcohol dehydrogenase family)